MTHNDTFSVACNNQSVLFAECDNLPTIEDALKYIEGTSGPTFSAHIYRMRGDQVIFDLHISYTPRKHSWSVDDPYTGWRYIRREDIPLMFESDNPYIIGR